MNTKTINIHLPKSDENVEVIGARVHNLKNIDVTIPRDSLTVITGLSGSGKSSLAFDTIFAEGQRRYIETFSAYARSFLGNMERPDVDKISGLSPVISIEQKTTNKNPRSTVGTTTEIYDFLRLLYARAGIAYSYLTNEQMVKYTDEQIVELILREHDGKKIYLLAPVVRGRKGHYRELFENIRKKGFLHVRIDGEMHEIVHNMKVDRYKIHDIEIVVDRLVVTAKDRKRLLDSMQKAMQQGGGVIMLIALPNPSKEGISTTLLGELEGAVRHYSRKLMCPSTGISYDEPAPHHFSFNSPHGYCPKCKGLGFVNEIDMDKIIPDKSVSIYNGGIAPLGKHKNSMIFWQIEAILEKYECILKSPISDIPDDAIDEIMNGTEERLNIKNQSLGNSNYFLSYDGILKYIEMQQENTASATEQKWANQYSKTIKCPECNGQRLRKESLFFRIHDKNIAELAEMDIMELYEC